MDDTTVNKRLMTSNKAKNSELITKHCIKLEVMFENSTAVSARPALMI